MAIELADLKINYAATAISDYEREASVLQVMTRVDDLLRGAYQCQIPIVSNLSTISTYTRKSGKAADLGFGTATSPSQKFLTLKADQNFRYNEYLDYDDQDELPMNMYMYMQAEHRRSVGRQVEDNILAWAAGLTYTGDNAISMGATGSNAEYIDPAGDPKAAGSGSTTDVMGFVFEAIKKMRLSLAKQNVRGPATLDPVTGTNLAGNSMFMLMRPELFALLEEYLEDKDIAYDRLSEDLYVEGSIFGNNDWEGSLKRVQLLVTTALPVPGTKDGAVWTMYGGVPAAWAVGLKPGAQQMFDPTNHPEDTWWGLRGKGRFGRVVLNDKYLYQVQIKAKNA